MIGIEFARAFSHEEQITVGSPVVVGGGDLSVMFSWGRHFETRQAFHSTPGPFWVILRLSHMSPAVQEGAEADSDD